MTIFNIITLFGGLALFLYGMRLMGDGLKRGSTDAGVHHADGIGSSKHRVVLLKKICDYCTTAG